MKFKYALIIFVFGFCLDYLGALLKILHNPNSETIFLIGFFLKATGAIVMVVKLSNAAKFKDLMNL